MGHTDPVRGTVLFLTGRDILILFEERVLQLVYIYKKKICLCVCVRASVCPFLRDGLFD